MHEEILNDLRRKEVEKVQKIYLNDIELPITIITLTIKFKPPDEDEF